MPKSSRENLTSSSHLPKLFPQVIWTSNFPPKHFLEYKWWKTICSWRLTFCPCLDILDQCFKGGEFWGFPLAMSPPSTLQFLRQNTQNSFVRRHVLLLRFMCTLAWEHPWHTCSQATQTLPSYQVKKEVLSFPDFVKILTQASGREVPPPLSNPLSLLHTCVSAPGYQEFKHLHGKDFTYGSISSVLWDSQWWSHHEGLVTYKSPKELPWVLYQAGTQKQGAMS